MNFEALALDPVTLAAIMGMAAATYATRVSGLFLVRRFRLPPRLEAGLQAMPGAILTALVAPMALATGPAETLAALVTLLVASRLPTILAFASGVATVALLRLLLS